jgi:hypothetical protein
MSKHPQASTRSRLSRHHHQANVRAVRRYPRPDGGSPGWEAILAQPILTASRYLSTGTAHRRSSAGVLLFPELGAPASGGPNLAHPTRVRSASYGRCVRGLPDRARLWQLSADLVDLIAAA